MITGLNITPLKQISSDKGDVYHALKCSEQDFSSFGEAYFSSIYDGKVKGWKKHTRMVLNIVVPVGSIKFVIYDDRVDSPTFNQYQEVILSADGYSRISVPPNVWMAFQGLTSGTNLLLNLASIEHDPGESKNAELSSIPYDWG